MCSSECLCSDPGFAPTQTVQQSESASLAILTPPGTTCLLGAGSLHQWLISSKCATFIVVFSALAKLPGIVPTAMTLQTRQMNLAEWLHSAGVLRYSHCGAQRSCQASSLCSHGTDHTHLTSGLQCAAMNSCATIIVALGIPASLPESFPHSADSISLTRQCQCERWPCSTLLLLWAFTQQHA